MMLDRLWRFAGGIHPPGRKELSRHAAITDCALAERLYLPLHQHIGEPATPQVKIGARVLKGQLIASAAGPVSAPIHAPTSGHIVDIAEFNIPHPSGLSAPCLVLEPDGAEEWAPLMDPLPDYAAHDPQEVRTRVREAGIVGLGGAAFPTFIKLNPGDKQVVEYLIINGAECEPYITSDERLMLERAAAVIQGALVMRHAVQARQCVIGIENNKPEAIAAMQAAATAHGGDVRVVPIPTVYPTGGEKQLIRVLTGKKVPSRGLPLHVGVVCHNIATAHAVKQAVIDGRPLISRVVTVTGTGIRQPTNLETPLGTPIHFLIGQAGGYSDAFHRLVMGGPMMGFALKDDRSPVVKATNCVLASGSGDLADDRPALPCIRCGQCTGVCPMRLLPQQLYWYSRSKEFDRVQDYNLFDCIECGCCTYVCPAHIPLVHYFRFSKNEIWAQERERSAADRAKLRFEAREARVARDKAEREEKMRAMKEAMAAKKAADEKKKASVTTEADTPVAASKPVRRAAENIRPHHTEGLTPEQLRREEELERRRQRIRDALESALGGEE